MGEAWEALAWLAKHGGQPVTTLRSLRLDEFAAYQRGLIAALKRERS